MRELVDGEAVKRPFIIQIEERSVVPNVHHQVPERLLFVELFLRGNLAFFLAPVLELVHLNNIHCGQVGFPVRGLKN